MNQHTLPLNPVRSFMRLKNKVSLALLLCCISLLLLITLQRHFYTLPELRALQHQADFSQVQRAENAIQQQIREIQRLAYDYGVWDDTYQFTQIQNPDYLSSNYVADTFKSLAADAILIYANDNTLLWSSGYDRRNDVLADIKSLLPARSISDAELAIDPARYQPGTPVIRTGIKKGRDNALLYASVSIAETTPGTTTGGSFAIIRQLDQALLGTLQTLSQVHFQLHTRESFRLNPQAALVAQLANNTEEDFLRIREKGYRWLRDESGSPIYLLDVDLPPMPFDDSLIDSVTLGVSGLLALSILLLRLVLDRLIVTPIGYLNAHLRTIRETANYGLRVAQDRDDEIGDLEKECNSLVHYVGIQEGYLRDLNHTLMVRTLEDSLTSIANRRHFDAKLHLQWLAFRQKREPLFLMLIDVDNFKQYNDHYGHPKGDNVLRKVAEALYTHVRMTTDTVARYGGEEFAVILTETNTTGAEITAQKLLEAVRKLNIPHAYSEHKRITISIGCAGWVPRERSSDTMLAKADEALYTAKQQGRDCIVFDFSGE